MKKNIKKIISAILATTILSSVAVFAVHAETETNNSVMSVEYDEGNAVEPEIQLFSSGTKLVKGTDYELTYENNVNVGTATINVSFKGNYTGTRTVNFNITPQELTSDIVEITPVEIQSYTGIEITPDVVIKNGDTTLVKDTDYELSYENNVNVGIATVNIAFKGNYTGTVSSTFEIVPQTVNPELVVFSEIEVQSFTGNAITPVPTITYDGITLEKGKDYELEYENNINAGIATINVSFKDNYSGMTSTSFEISAKVVTEANVVIEDIPDQKYTGSEIKPEPVIIDIGV